MIGTRDPEIGMEIGDSWRYRLTRKIADGGMSSVYEAILHGPEGFQKVVALKMILEKFSSDPRVLEMFVGEAKLVADLVHQNIVQIYHLGKTGNIYYIAMEYINGVNLEEFITRHRKLARTIPPDIGIFIISRICHGLEYAARKRDIRGNLLGVVHRDLCPRNLMISAEGEIKIADFGVAKAINLMVDNEGEVLLGRVGYMSPEQFQYLPTDHRSDLYSLTVVMYELVTGMSLSTHWGHGVIPGQRVAREVPPPRSINPNLPEEIERILLKGLQLDPQRRYQKAAEMAYDLEYFLFHKGYGTSVRTLQQYMGAIFPDRFELELDESDAEVSYKLLPSFAR
jgi:serine/threonine protein kinase